jgi:hypothetical protein
MAAKAPSKGAKTTVSKVTTKANATPKGLVLSAAQWKAYNAAYSAAASAARTKIALLAAANRFRAYRLGAAYATQKRAAAARGAAQTAAIAANATRMSWVQSKLGHQNAALRNRIEAGMYTHANIAGRLQYTQAGEQAYARQAVMRTVDQAQAYAYERSVFNRISKTAKKAVRSTVSTGKKTTLSKAQSAAIAKAGNTAGLAAAAKVRTAPRRRGTMNIAEIEFDREWIGNETEPHCVAYAIANHLLYDRGTTGIRLHPADVAELAELAGPEPTIEEALWRAYMAAWPAGRQVRLADYKRVEDDKLRTARILGPLVIGYGTMFGDHCALSLPAGGVVSWGEIGPLKADIEEAWELTWES